MTAVKPEKLTQKEEADFSSRPLLNMNDAYVGAAEQNLLKLLEYIINEPTSSLPAVSADQPIRELIIY